MLSFSEACDRNKDPIFDVLAPIFASRAHVLEIGSGTGQHAVHFAARLPHLLWQPTDRLLYLADLAARVTAQGSVNLQPPAVLDVRQNIWPVTSVDAIFTANTLHIMSWEAVVCCFAGIARILTPSGVLCIYGPFRYHGEYTSPSNQAFDCLLREGDALAGIRDITAVSALAADIGLSLVADHDLPAFNRLLIFAKEPG